MITGEPFGIGEVNVLFTGDTPEMVEAIHREEIELARPDDLAFLEFQVPRIACRIASLLGSRRPHRG